MDAPHLVYFADPMCSWCWGFAAVIDAVRDRWGGRLPIRLVMGGLRPGTTEAMAEPAKAELRGHWAHVTEASGQPFGPSGMDAQGFVYDTDPAARAVVFLRGRAPGREVDFLHILQHAFYAGGQDVTRPRVLAELAAPFGIEPEAFLTAFDTDAAKQAAWRDYAVSRGAGVSGFPTLILGPRTDGTYVAISRGFQSKDVVVPAIAHCLEARVLPGAPRAGEVC